MTPLEVGGKIAGPVRLQFLDGIRGIAALYVVLSHISYLGRFLFEVQSPYGAIERTWNFAFYYLLGYGNFAVGIFIVLSGFPLMIPAAKNERGELSGGTTGFVKRRARRILPPYFVAVACCLLLLAVLPHVGVSLRKMEWYSQIRGSWSPGSLISHLMLIHNWTPYFYSIEAPLWSVGLEWQIYFVFVFLLLPLYRKLGPTVTLAAAFIISCFPIVLHINAFHRTNSWFVGLFCLGMIGAAICYDRSARYARLKSLLFWRIMVCTFWVLPILYVYWQHWRGIEIEHSVFIPEVLMGFGIVSFIVYHCLILLKRQTDTNITVRILQSRPVERLGIFSYSLYLMHYPVLQVIWYFLRYSDLPTSDRLGIFLALGTVFSLAFTYLFHVVVERRFLPTQLKVAEVELNQPYTT